MAFEQQFRVAGPITWGSGTTASVFPTAQDWSNGNFASTGGCLQVGIFAAAKLRGLVFHVFTTIGAGTAPVFTTNVWSSMSVAHATGTARPVNATATVPVGTVKGSAVFYFFSDADIRVNPGEQVNVYCSTAATAGAGFVGLMLSDYMIGPTSGGTLTSPTVRSKPYGATTEGSVYVISTGSTGN